MNAEDRNRNQASAPSDKPKLSVRPWLRLVLAAILLGSLASVLVYVRLRPAAPAPGVLADTAEAAAWTEPIPEPLPPVREPAVVAIPPKPARTSATAPATPPVAWPEPSPHSRQLVNSLARLDLPGGTMTPEEAAAWTQNLQQLVQRGSDAVPAILEFLKQDKDLDFGSGLSQTLGYGSVRRAMFDALAQIGGPEAVQAARETLQNSADPREIALLAQTLDKLAPEEYRQEAVQAAREALGMAANGKLQGADVAPLFEVLGKYGGGAAISDLEQ